MKGAPEGGSGERGWLSAHLHFEGDLYGPPADEVLWQVAEPMVRSALREPCVDRWFFLRYNQPSSHLRLRLGLTSTVHLEAVRERIEAVFESHPQESGKAAVTDLRWVPYEPEWDRYGGPFGVALAEDLFHRSSETALALLRKVAADDRPTRLGKAMLAMLVLIHGYTPQRRRAAAFSRSYGYGYLHSLVPDPQAQQRWLATFEAGFERQAGGLSQYLEVAWEALEDGEPMTPELDLYREQMVAHGARLQAAWEQKKLSSEGEQYPSWEDCFHRVVPGYLHMMNNRLGISLQEESYLSVLIDWTLRHPETMKQLM